MMRWVRIVVVLASLCVGETFAVSPEMGREAYQSTMAGGRAPMLSSTQEAKQGLIKQDKSVGGISMDYPEEKSDEDAKIQVKQLFVRDPDRKCEKDGSFSIELPSVELNLFGELYTVEGGEFEIHYKIVPELDVDVSAQWDSDANVMVIPRTVMSVFKFIQNENNSSWLKAIKAVYETSQSPKKFKEKFVQTVRHEAIHAKVDETYRKLYEDENGKLLDGEVNAWYHFVSEMLAYVGGDGLSVENAAKMIRDHPKLYNTNFNAGDIADKFLRGEEYTPPHVRRNLESEKSISVPKLFDRDLQCKKTTKCEKKVCHDSNSVKDTEATDSTDAYGKDSTGEVGIKGWCMCLEKQETSGARSIMVGRGLERLVYPTSCMPRYSYRFCLRCGKCRRPDLNSDNRKIFDNQLEVQLATTNGLRTCDYVNARKEVERKFINIPDGQIVFPGKCTCKEPDPIRDGFMNNYVCVICGRCYVPVNNTVPIGPTARKELGLK